MEKPIKRSTIYLDKDLHKALKIKSAETSRSISELISEAVKTVFNEDFEDISDYKKRKKEDSISFDEFLQNLKINGKI